MRTVLIADDQASLRLLVSATLTSDRWRIIEAIDGDEAWQLIQSHHPDLALLDVQMPGRTGLELAQAIRASAELAQTQVVLLTSKAMPSDIEAGLAAGADQYMTKPFSPLELLERVEQWLR